MSKKKRKAWATKIKKITPYHPCKDCGIGYKGVEKDIHGKVLRRFDCRQTCSLREHGSIYIEGLT
jgi:hypothetical protein